MSRFVYDYRGTKYQRSSDSVEYLKQAKLEQAAAEDLHKRTAKSYPDKSEIQNIGDTD